jgi:bilirubin oxidase
MPETPVSPIWNPEFFGDVVVVNGRSWPFMQVEPRRYRFRMLGGANARFWELHLENRVVLPASAGPPIYVIGTDGGPGSAGPTSSTREPFSSPPESATT